MLIFIDGGNLQSPTLPIHNSLTLMTYYMYCSTKYIFILIKNTRPTSYYFKSSYLRNHTNQLTFYLNKIIYIYSNFLPSTNQLFLFDRATMTGVVTCSLIPVCGDFILLICLFCTIINQININYSLTKFMITSVHKI